MEVAPAAQRLRRGLVQMQRAHGREEEHQHGRVLCPTEQLPCFASASASACLLQQKLAALHLVHAHAVVQLHGLPQFRFGRQQTAPLRVPHEAPSLPQLRWLALQQPHQQPRPPQLGSE